MREAAASRRNSRTDDYAFRDVTAEAKDGGAAETKSVPMNAL
jgi:hypothetical protein